MKTICSILTGCLAACGVMRTAAVTVTNLNDSGPGSLRAALAMGGNIEFAVQGTILLTTGQLEANLPTTITGPGAEQLQIARSAVAGTPDFRVLLVRGAPVTISRLTISGGLIGEDYDSGAGIRNEGTLTLNDCVVRGNRSTGEYARGTGLFNASAATLIANRCVFAENVGAGPYAEGNGIYVFGTVTLNDSTFHGNRGEGAYSRGGGLHVDYYGSAGVARCTFSSNLVVGVNAQGGGIYNYGRLEIVNSTLSGNSAGDTGGGMHVDWLSPSTTVRNCTISGNAAKTGAGLVNGGPGLSAPRGTLTDSIIAGNASDDLALGGILVSSGHNLIGQVGGGFFVPALADQLGVTAEALKLAPLASNGGPTQTRALLAGSSAIDGGNPTNFPATDQRGAARPFGSRPDIGAFELDVILPPVVTVVASQPNTVEAGPTVFVAPGVFTISRAGSTNDPLRVFYRLSGTASNGVDYQFLSNSVVIPAGQKSAELWVVGLFDGLVEGTERVVLNLEELACPAIYPPPPECYLVGKPAEAVVQIHDYEQPTNRPPVVEIFAPANHQVFTAPADIFIAAQANDPDGYDSVLFVEFFANNQSLGIRTNWPTLDPIGPFKLTWTNVPAGEYQLTARATDDHGATITSEPVHVNVRPQEPPTNQVPRLTIITPAEDEVFTVPTVIQICADLRDTNGAVTLLEFFAGTNWIGRRTNCLSCNPFCLFWTNPPPGEYALTVKGFGFPNGEAVTSKPVHVNVRTNLPPTNQPPTVTLVAPTNGAVFIAPAQIQICADARDTNGYVDYVEFFAGTNKIGARTNCLPCASIQNPFCITWPNVPPGEYTLTAKVTDNQGAMTTSAPVHIAVRASGSNHLSFRLAFDNPNANAAVFFRDYTLNGPAEGDRLLPADRVVSAGGDRYFYGAKPHFVWRIDQHTGEILPLNPGQNLPELSWPMGITFDTKRQRLVLASLGGEGFLYAYRPLSNHWSVIRDLDNRDVDCLTYHASQDAFYAVRVSWSGGPNSLYRFNAEGGLQSELPLPELPFGIGPVGYRSELVSIGDYLVLLLEADLELDPYGESRIYLIDPRNADVQLTYRRVRPRPNEPPHVQLNLPAPGSVFAAPAQIALHAFAYDQEDGHELKVEFFAGTNSLGLGTFVPALCPSPYCPFFALTWSNVPPGHHVLTARATDSNGTTIISPPVEITVFDPLLAVVTIRATDANASESGNSGEFTISREGNTNGALRVFYSVHGSAWNGVDYLALSNSVVMAAGARTATVSVIPIDDEVFEGTEQVELRLMPGLNSISYVVGSPSNAVVNIADNESHELPVVTIEAADPNASESPGHPGQFTVRRSGPTNETLWIFWEISGTASNGVDYARLTNVVTIPAGRKAVEFAVTPIDDNLFEGTETVVAQLYYPPFGSPLPPTYTIGFPSNAVVNIADNEDVAFPVVTIEAPHAEASETPGHPGLFHISRTGPTNHSLVVFWQITGTASSGVDYRSLTNPVVIPAGHSFVRAAVVPIDDTVMEIQETVSATLFFPPIDVAFPYTIGSPSNATVTILDNDPPPPFEPAVVTIEATDPHARETGLLTVVEPGRFTIRRTGNTNPTLHVQCVISGSASNGVDYIALSNIVVIPSGVTVVQVPVYPINDNLDEGTETVRVSLQPPICVAISPPPPECYEVGVPGSATVFISDPDVPEPGPLPVVSVIARDPVASEGTNCLRWIGWPAEASANFCTNTAAFIVRRTGATNDPLIVRYELAGTASNGVDYAALPGALAIPAGSRTATILVVPLDDALTEHTETIRLSLRVPSTDSDAPPAYQLGWPRRAGALLVDNDRPRPPSGPLGDWSFHFTRPGSNGAWFRIETSTNLVHWTALCTNVVTDGAIHFVDPDAEDLPNRFYRAVPQPEPPVE